MAVIRLKPTSYTINYRGESVVNAEIFVSNREPENIASSSAYYAHLYGSTRYEGPSVRLYFPAVNVNNITNITLKYRAYDASHQSGSGASEGAIKLCADNPFQVIKLCALSTNNLVMTDNDCLSYNIPQEYWSIILESNWHLRVEACTRATGTAHTYAAPLALDIEYTPTYTPTKDFKIGINKLKKAFLGSTAIQKIYKGVQLLYDSASVLPAEYQEVEYIGFDGSNSGQSTSAYFDTGIVPSATKGFYLDANITQGASGSSDGANGKTMIRGWSDNTELYWDGDVDKKQPYVVGRHTWTIDYYNHRVGYDTTYDTISNPTTGYATATFFLGAWHEWGTAYYGMAGRVYGFKAYDNDSLIADYIPCYRKSDGVIGFYDAVTETFKTKSGSGVVSKGLDIGWTLPAEYQQVEYIQASGDIYIDANYSAKESSTFYLDYIDEKDHSDVVYANYFYTSYYRFIRYPNLNYAVLENRTGSDSMAIVHVPSATYNTRHQLEFAKDRVTDGDGINYVIYPSLTGNYGNPNNLVLFRGYYWGNWDNYGYYKLYNFRVYEDNGGTLIRNYVPCYRKSDNVIGLYETRQGVFYTGTGTGSFTKGPDVN